jgi:hypothetical protein
MRLATLLVTGALALAGCGSGTSRLLHPSSSSTSGSASGSAPADAVRVIRGWSQALRSGHVTAAAAYFRIPSVFFQGGGAPVQIRSRIAAQIVNAALPCGALLISTHREGRFVNALFRLTNRSGRGGAGGCGSGTGQTARTNFLIENGLIVEWLRAPDEPGDNGSPKTGPGPAAPPGTVPAAPPAPEPTTPTSPDTTPGGGTPVA